MGLVNAFANDGSFMELFKQRMAQEAIAADAATPGVAKDAESTDKTRQPFASLVRAPGNVQFVEPCSVWRWSLIARSNWWWRGLLPR